MASANMMMWGSVDEGKSIFADDRVRPAMEALAKKLYWQPSTVSPQLPVNELPADATEQDIPEDALRAAVEATGYHVTAFRSEPYEKKSLFHRG